jgi:hypothetical protein
MTQAGAGHDRGADILQHAGCAFTSLFPARTELATWMLGPIFSSLTGPAARLLLTLNSGPSTQGAPV